LASALESNVFRGLFTAETDLVELAFACIIYELANGMDWIKPKKWSPQNRK